MEKNHLQEAVKQIPSATISHDAEDWILTPEEEKIAIEYAIYLRAKTLKDPIESDRIDKATLYYQLPHNRRMVLAACNSNIHQDLWHKEQRLNRITEAQSKQQELIKKCDANYFYKLIQISAGKKLIKNDNTFPYLKTLCYFFSNDERFETELNLDFGKGLWIRGETGRGKTFPLQCIQDNELAPFEIHSMLNIAKTVAEDGEYSLKGFLKVIDDVGSEQSIVNHYGTKINWFKDFIELWYAELKPFNRLIVTTNFDFDQVEKSYGFRVRSRIKDMFNVCDVKGDDLRGKI